MGEYGDFDPESILLQLLSSPTSGLPGSAQLESPKHQGAQTEVEPAVVYSARRGNPKLLPKM